MTAKSHLILTLLPLGVYYHLNGISYNYYEVGPNLLAAGFGALLPDIDEPNSYIGKRFIFVSELLKLIGIKHRTYTHSIFFPIIIALFGFLNPLFFYVAYGVFMHILEDALTNSGVPLFYPLSKKRFGLKLFNTGSIGEYIFVFIFFLVGIYFLQNANFSL